MKFSTMIRVYPLLLIPILLIAAFGIIIVAATDYPAWIKIIAVWSALSLPSWCYYHIPEKKGLMDMKWPFWIKIWLAIWMIPGLIMHIFYMLMCTVGEAISPV